MEIEKPFCLLGFSLSVWKKRFSSAPSLLWPCKIGGPELEVRSRGLYLSSAFPPWGGTYFGIFRLYNMSFGLFVPSMCWHLNGCFFESSFRAVDFSSRMRLVHHCVAFGKYLWESREQNGQRNSYHVTENNIPRPFSFALWLGLTDLFHFFVCRSPIFLFRVKNNNSAVYSFNLLIFIKVNI